ncbi:DUF2087 domain-containing protein [Bifidobacterium sp.]|jgi:hypothetical protein|uniref:DUF2087 domain-containing protein n=1 Tax=Bifidobacterium sp. TaxID=41200 RepID=UPI0025BBCA45|nr:DUF2087 domain-containing protein [Bifidobacterium sp.]MCH4209131.1 DUF2087 domain-containing protein [Bifidobacterium sp.]
MTFVNRYQRRLREYRTLLDLLRTPKLRTAVASALGSDPEPASLPLNAPLNQISWLSCTRNDSVRALAHAKSDIEDLLSAESILLCERISVMPHNARQREQIIQTVFERVFAYSSHSWLTEAELNAKLSMLVEDVAGIRRYGVDRNIIERTANGRKYWLSKKAANAASTTSRKTKSELKPGG